MLCDVFCVLRECSTYLPYFAVGTFIGDLRLFSFELAVGTTAMEQNLNPNQKRIGGTAAHASAQPARNSVGKGAATYSEWVTEITRTEPAHDGPVVGLSFCNTLRVFASCALDHCVMFW